MKRKLLSTALAPAILLTSGLLGSAMGQDSAIVRAVPESSPEVSYYQERTPIQQPSPSDSSVQPGSVPLQEQQQLDDPTLRNLLDDPTIGSIFEEGTWPRKTIRAINIDIREKSENAPKDISTKLLDSQPGTWSSFSPAPKVYAWAAPNIRYQPLYFEDVALERYGQIKNPSQQAIRSGVHFFTSIGLIPWHLCQDPPNSCDYPLGFCRPGDDVPCTKQHLFYYHAEK